MTALLYTADRSKDANLSQVTAVAINPGTMVDSRSFRSNTPTSMVRLQRIILKPLLPILKVAVNPAMRTAALAAVDVIQLAVDPAYSGERGFFTLLQKDQSSPDSQDEGKQQSLWSKTLEWAKITRDNTALKAAFD